MCRTSLRLRIIEKSCSTIVKIVNGHGKGALQKNIAKIEAILCSVHTVNLPCNSCVWGHFIRTVIFIIIIGIAVAHGYCYIIIILIIRDCTER